MTISTSYEAQARRVEETFSDIVSETRILRLASDEPLKLRLEIVDGSVVDQEFPVRLKVVDWRGVPAIQKYIFRAFLALP